MKHRHVWQFDGGAGSANDGESCRLCHKLKENTWPHMLWLPGILIFLGLLVGLVLGRK